MGRWGIILKECFNLVIDRRIAFQVSFALFISLRLFIDRLKIYLGLRVNDTLTLSQIVNWAYFGERSIKGSLRAGEFLLADYFCEGLMLLFLFLHVLKGCTERTLSLIGNIVVCIVLARPWICLILHWNISNSFDRIGIDKLSILKHGSWAKWNFTFVPALLRLVSFDFVGSWTWVERRMTHKVLVHEPGFCCTRLIVFHIK